MCKKKNCFDMYKGIMKNYVEIEGKTIKLPRD